MVIHAIEFLPGDLNWDILRCFDNRRVNSEHKYADDGYDKIIIATNCEMNSRIFNIKISYNRCNECLFTQSAQFQFNDSAYRASVDIITHIIITLDHIRSKIHPNYSGVIFNRIFIDPLTSRFNSGAL